MKDLEKIKLEYIKSLAALSFTYKQLDQFLSTCYNEKGEFISPTEKDIIKLRSLLPKNYKNSK